MGDMSGEPSMEHILSSIKRIIAEDGEATAGERRERRAARMPLARPAEQDEQDEQDDVLELSEPIAETNPEDGETMADLPEAIAPEAAAEETPPELISPQAAAASKTSLEALSRLVVRPEVTGSDTLEGMVREMLKPMLAEWLDTNLPQIVDQQVAREIARITGR
jgi:cell pole-organizing protein PopZ